MQDGMVTIACSARMLTFPSLHLACALHPLPPTSATTRAATFVLRQQIARYLAKISSPLLDRIDLQVEGRMSRSAVLSARSDQLRGS